MTRSLNTERHLRFVLLFFLLLPLQLFAEGEFPARPEPPRLVNDFAGILSEAQRAQLEGKLVDFDRQTSTQIAVVTVPTLHGYDRADYAYRLAEQWGIGQKGKNNGILILVKPKTASERGEVYVAVGYGLEGAVPDAVAHRTIIQNEIIPSFRANDYYGGLERATGVLMSLVKGEFTADQYQQQSGKEVSPFAGLGFIIFLFVVFLLVGRSRRHHSVGSNTGSLLNTLILMNMFGGNHRGSWGDFSSGSGGFSGGGGFGGFGGGSFGGGGAGGSW